MNAPKTAYRMVTHQIEVRVTPRFMPARSSPENGYYFWAYAITLTNLGRETVQLKTRHWRITDVQGRLQEVRGAGVVGEEPVLKPGEKFKVYQRRSPAHAIRLHDRQLWNGERQRRAIRHRHSGLFARHSPAGAHDQLSAVPRRLPVLKAEGAPRLGLLNPARRAAWALPRIHSPPAARTRMSNCRIRR